MTARILLLFFLSGATSLVYEVLWMRRLSLVFGHSLFSVSTVLTTFMTGLALGSYWGGRWSDRQRQKGRPDIEFLKTYGYLEAAIGLWAVLSLVLLDGVEAVFLSLARGGEQGVALTAFLFLASFLVLLPPTTAMGATLPIFTQVLVGRTQQTGLTLSTIYGLNTLGACCGAAFGGFVGLPQLGLQRTVLLTASLNVVIALLAISLTRRLASVAPSSGAEPPAEPSPGGSVVRGRWVPLVFGLSGFAGMVYQLGWTRALVLSIGSSTYSFSIILTSFLASLGLGSILYRRFFLWREPRVVDLARLQLGLAVSALLVTLAMGWLPRWKMLSLPYLGESFGRVALFDTVAVALLLLLPTLALGLTFPLVTHLYTTRLEELGRRLGEAYAANTTGAILGSFLGGFVLLPWLGLQGSIELAASLNLGAGLLLLWPLRRSQEAGGRRSWLLALLTLGLLLFSPSWDLGLLSSGAGIGYQGQRWRPPPIFYRDGVTSTVTVGINGGRHPYIAVNGKTDASLTPADRGTQLLLGLLPGTLHPDPREVAVIGFGSGQTPVALLSIPEVQRVRCAELEPAVLEARKFFAPFSEGVFDDPRLDLVLDDGRSFILGSPQKFDLIVSEPSNPWIAGIGNLYTRDFYEGCRRQLKEGGLMGQWFHLYAMAEPEVQMVYRTFFSVFPEGAIYRTGPGDILLVGGERVPPLDPERVQAIYSGSGRAAFWLASLELPDPRMLYATYLASRQEVIAYLQARGSGFPEGPINTDDRPLLEFQAPLSLYSQRGVVREATASFETLLPANVQGNAAFLQAAVLGRRLLSLSLDPEGALNALRLLDPRALAWYPDLVAPVLEGDALEGADLLRQARPHDLDWLRLFVLVWKTRQSDDRGLGELFAEALREPPPGFRLWLLLGAAREAARRGQWGVARQFYQEAVPLSTGDDALAELGALDFPTQADAQLLREAIARNPYNAESRYRLASLLAARPETQEEALEQALESRRLFPQRADVLQLLVELYRQKGDHREVMRYGAEERAVRYREELRGGRT